MGRQQILDRTGVGIP